MLTLAYNTAYAVLKANNTDVCLYLLQEMTRR